MKLNKNSVVYSTMIALTVFGLLGWSLALEKGRDVSAQSGMMIDGETLDDLYDAVFHRPADSEGRGYHLGRDLKSVLKDFKNSHELRYYGALFKAVKSYEEAQRAPGTLTEVEKQSYLDLIDSALSNLLAWVATLPDQAACKATVGAAEAREAIQRAYDGMSPEAKAAAEKGIFNALKKLGNPRLLKIHPKCLRPTPSVSVSPSASPTASPSPTPTASPTATPTPSPTVSGSPAPSPTASPTPTPAP